MIPIPETSLIQIEITNACHLSCAHCTRFVGHHQKPFYMTLEQIENAIRSLDGYKGGIGMMGGEPAIHPQFAEICKLYQKLIPQKRRRQLWTAGFKWKEYRDLIMETFDEDLIVYNDHSDPGEGTHQPLLVAIEEVIEDKALMWRMIDNCWIQRRWSASITPKGAFFCEVAAAQSILFNGPDGYPVEPGWWDKKPEDFQDQARQYCPRCSAALPVPFILNNHTSYDLVSPGNAKRLEAANSPKFKDGRYEVIDLAPLKEYVKNATGEPGEDRGSFKDFPDWTPWRFRKKIWHGPGEGTLSAKEVRELQTSRKA